MTKWSSYLYVPAFLRRELTQDETHEFSITIAEDLANRTRHGGLFVFVCILLGSTISEFMARHPVFLYSLSLMALVFGVARTVLAKRVPNVTHSFVQWQRLYSLIILGSAVAWLTFFSLHIYSHHFDESTLILLIATAGYLGTLTSTMFMWLPLCLVYIFILVIPILVTLFMVEIKISLVLSVGFVVYIFFLLTHVLSLNKQYWRSLQAQIKLKKQAQELTKAKDEAEHAVQVKTQFLSSMSHELRTPLNAVIGFSHLLETDTQTPLSVEHKESVGVIKTSATHLLNLINDILDLVKVDAGQITFNMRPMLVDKVIDEVFLIHQPKAEREGLVLNKHILAESQYRIVADEVRFKQVMINLVSNAIKYNRKQGAVDVVARKDNSNILIEVFDTGFGIEDDKINSAFEAFNRLGKEKTAISGTGIGLSICKDLVERMGGEIGAHTNYPSGMVFWVKFKALELVKE